MTHTTPTPMPGPTDKGPELAEAWMTTLHRQGLLRQATPTRHGWKVQFTPTSPPILLPTAESVLDLVSWLQRLQRRTAP
ncbi:hypothetical protein [Streptomyces sedi]|uniref:Uncharacterized protein n=1 Tax=Streptomyces sedi TaxID=555059 RepID=A0A5C4UNG2_9ACTN|nr:hypothetical protein [Streptomyces sedi]TNM24579.1 hypothetical protein FH715_27255 [Streptomyces sedi]